MGEMGNLYKNVIVRFSLINEQHVRSLQGLERLSKSTGESRNQIIINAVEMYCGGVDRTDETERALDGIKEEIRRYGEVIKEQIKNEVRQEVLKELIGVVSGINPQGMAGMVPQARSGPDGEENSPDPVPALEEDAGILENALKWG